MSLMKAVHIRKIDHLKFQCMNSKPRSNQIQFTNFECLTSLVLYIPHMLMCQMYLTTLKFPLLASKRYLLRLGLGHLKYCSPQSPISGHKYLSCRLTCMFLCQQIASLQRGIECWLSKFLGLSLPHLALIRSTLSLSSTAY